MASASAANLSLARQPQCQHLILRKRLNAPTFRLLNGLIEGGKTRPGEHAIGGEVIAVTTHALDELELALRMRGKRNVPDQMSEQQRSGGQK
jgi:hypothetical protein